MVNNKKKVKGYYDLAHDYNVAAALLWINITTSDYLFGPCVYLLRHTIELLLKGLIVKETSKQETIVNEEKIKIGQGNDKKVLNFEHSLVRLYTYYKKIGQKNNLSFYFSEKEDGFILNQLEYWERVDETSTYYRYPFGKNGKKNNVEPVSISRIDIMPDISNNIPCIIDTEGYRIIRRGSQLMGKVQNLFDVANILFERYN